MSENYMLVLIYTTKSIDTLACCGKPVKIHSLTQAFAVIGKQVLAFGKSEKSEFREIGNSAASSGGATSEVLCQIGRDHMYELPMYKQRVSAMIRAPDNFSGNWVFHSLKFY